MGRIFSAVGTTNSVKVKHHATKHVRHVAKKHYKAMKVAKRHHMREHVGTVKTDVDSTTRDARMEEALRKFRTSHS